LFLCTVAYFSAAEKARGVNFACMLAYYPDRSSPVLVKFGLQGVTAVAFFVAVRIGTRNHENPNRTCRGMGPDGLLCQLRRGSVAIGNWGWRHCLRPYGGCKPADALVSMSLLTEQRLSCFAEVVVDVTLHIDDSSWFDTA